MLHNYCEASKDMVDDNNVAAAIQHDRENQPDTEAATRGDCMTSEEKRVRWILTQFLYPLKGQSSLHCVCVRGVVNITV